jgi:hypothetical protein
VSAPRVAKNCHKTTRFWQWADTATSFNSAIGIHPVTEITGDTSMKKLSKYTAIALITTAVGVGAASASGWGDRSERGAGCGHPQRMMMDKSQRMQRDLDLSADQVRTLVEARLIIRGNDRLKVGEVTPKDDNTYQVKIVTVDGSLVREFDVDKHRGLRRFGRR